MVGSTTGEGNAVAEPAGPMESDDDAVAELHRELAEQLKRLAWAMLGDWSLADDAVQDAFLLFIAKEKQIPANQRRGWLVRTVQYSALNLRRSRQRQGRLIRETSEVYRSQSEERGAADASMDEELEFVRAAMGRLPPEQQVILHKRLGEEMSFKQIAEELKLPLGTVLSRMRLALEKLRR